MATATNYRRVLSAATLNNDRVENAQGEKLGTVEDIMIDLQEGKVAYVVLSFGGFLGMGDKLFAIPWNAIRVDEDKKCLVLNIEKEKLKTAPGFDKDHWPDMADPTWSNGIRDFYGQSTSRYM